jgi:hypothetical protein
MAENVVRNFGKECIAGIWNRVRPNFGKHLRVKGMKKRSAAIIQGCFKHHRRQLVHN